MQDDAKELGAKTLQHAFTVHRNGIMSLCGRGGGEEGDVRWLFIQISYLQSCREVEDMQPLVQIRISSDKEDVLIQKDFTLQNKISNQTRACRGHIKHRIWPQ